MVTLLWPGIGKEDQDFVQAGTVEVTVQHLHGVAADYPHVAKSSLFELQQQPTHARPMHFDAEEIFRRMCRREREQVVAVAEPDLGDPPGTAAKERIEVEQRGARLDAVPRPKLFERPLLR